MKKKHNKKQQVLSESSDENLLNGITTPQGPAARGRIHPDSNFNGTCTQGSASPLASGQWSTGHWSFTHKTTRHHWSTGHQSPVTVQPVTTQPVITQINRSQSITGHPVTGHWTEIQTPGRSIFTGQQVTGQPATGHWTYSCHWHGVHNN